MLPRTEADPVTRQEWDPKGILI